jgi:RNA-directed DNA polymerase
VARHPQQTQIVSGKDDDRRGTALEAPFDFLGSTFRPRRSTHRGGKYCINCSPGVSHAAAQVSRQAMRRWQRRCRVDKQSDDLARMFNPISRGWLTYSTRSYKSALYPTLQHLDRQLARWAMAKYKRLRRHRWRAEQWLRRVARRQPGLFAHWRLLHVGAER